MVKSRWIFLTMRNVSDKSCRENQYTITLRINNQQDPPCIQNFILSRNSTCFGHLLCPSSGVISCTRGNCYVSCRLCGRCPKHVEFRDKIKILDTWCILLVIYTKIITIHDHLNIKYTITRSMTPPPPPAKTSCSLWNNYEKYSTARQATDDSIIRRMRVACQITKATGTHSEYVIYIAFPRRQWHERATLLHYTCIACLLVPWTFTYLRTQR
jgi:hypothetical protein